jgi:hypothetical protein
LIRVHDFQMHPAQLFADARIFRCGDEIQVGSQGLERAQGLPQLMYKIGKDVFTIRLRHYRAS